ncbi:MAG: hypothetical protein SXA11_24785 [Cyanobacteriota bacterium]|nr:hypothetical protein [Cyanobacteriota bacterium]
MEPEAIINAFLEVIKKQPELFDEKTLQDLPELELVIERLEYEEDDEKVELAADAIVDFYESNHQIADAITKLVESRELKRKYGSFYSEVQIIHNTIPLLQQAIKDVLDERDAKRPGLKF